MKELQEDAIKQEDYSKAQDLKADISDVQDKIQELKATLMGSVIINSVNCTEDSTSDHEDVKFYFLSENPPYLLLTHFHFFRK